MPPEKEWLCPNCLLMKWRKQRLHRNHTGTYTCEAYDGCKAQFTEAYLQHAIVGMRHMLEVMDPKDKTLGDPPSPVNDGARRVKLPKDGE